MKSPSDTPQVLTASGLSHQKNVVRRFYQEMWDRANTSIVPELFHPDFTFRGSLGPVLVGNKEFGEYVSWLTDTLDEYRTDIFSLVEEGNTVIAKVRFRGIHVKPFFGFPPTGNRVWWYGIPIFTFSGDRVHDLWVLGDIHGLVGRLAGKASDCAFAKS